MQIVIDIPKEIYRCIIKDGYFFDDETNIIRQAIKNGTPLPKGHGDLIDADKLEPDTEWNDYEDGFISYSRNQIKCANAIVEADKTESEALE